MSLRFIRTTIAVILAAIILAALAWQEIRKERRKEAAATPTPRPTPAGIYVPEKRMEVAKLFNDISINASVETENGLTAEMERDDPSSYTLNLQLKVRVPKPNTSLQDLQKLNVHLPKALPWLEASLPTATVSSFYDDFYRSKVSALNKELPRLETLISRQHFFDCETVLQLVSTTTKRRALLIQAPMEVDTDGSDGDRVSAVDANSSTYQPMTSYKWAKKTDKENPLLAASEERLRKLTQELFPKGIPDRGRDLPQPLIDARYEVAQLKKNSFLVGAVDPYIVLPSSLVNSSDYEPYTPKTGDYCVVIYDQTLYPAIVGDVGPYYKIGEASLRICKEIDARSSANNRPVSELKVTYLVFPGSADKPFDAPDLGLWHARCDELLNEMGGYKGELKTWEDLTKPKPTPTPTPTPSTPTPSPSASPSVSPSARPGASTPPAASPAPSSSPASASPAPSVPATPAKTGT